MFERMLLNRVNGGNGKGRSFRLIKAFNGELGINQEIKAIRGNLSTWPDSWWNNPIEINQTDNILTLARNAEAGSHAVLVNKDNTLLKSGLNSETKEFEINFEFIRNNASSNYRAHINLFGVFRYNYYRDAAIKSYINCLGSTNYTINNNVGVWHKIKLTYKQSILDLFYNDELVRSVNTTTLPNNLTDNVRLGVGTAGLSFRNLEIKILD